MNMQNKLAQLFSFISQNPKCSLTKTFTHFAKKWSLSRDSVRNIYYQNYSKVLSDSSFCTKHSIKQANFKKNIIFVCVFVRNKLRPCNKIS